MRLDESHTLDGYWWPPENEDREVCGKLTYEPDEFITVETVGTLHPGGEDFEERMESTVHGRTTDGPVTLTRAQISPSNISIPGMAEWRADGLLAILGRNLDSPVNPLYLEAEATFSSLEQWMEQESVEVEAPGSENGDDRTTIRHQLPDPIEVEIGALDSNLEFRLESTLSPGRWSASVEGKASVKLVPSEDKPLRWYQDQFRLLRFFLALASGEKISLRSLSCTHEFEERDNDVVVPLRDEVLPAFEDQNGSDPRHPRMMPMSRTEFEDLESALDAWYDRADVLRPLIDLYFTLRYASPSYLNFRLLAITQGLEGYHRNAIGGGYVDPDEWEDSKQQLIEAIPDDLDSDHRNALKGKLKWGYEYSLRTRLRQLLNELSSEEQELVCSDIERFIADVVETRNAYTHRGGEGERLREQDAYEVDRMVYRLMGLSEILLLREIGLESDKVVEALSERSRRYPPVDSEET